jgi:hypothetical protein
VWEGGGPLAISGTGHKMLAPPPPIFTASIQSEEMGWRDVGKGGGEGEIAMVSKMRV